MGIYIIILLLMPIYNKWNKLINLDSSLKYQTSLNFNCYTINIKDDLTDIIEIAHIDLKKIIDSKYTALICLKRHYDNSVIKPQFLKKGYNDSKNITYKDKSKENKVKNCKSEYLKKYPFLISEREKFFYKYLVGYQMSDNHNAYVKNKIIYYVRYLENAIINSKIQMRINCFLDRIALSKILSKKEYLIYYQIKILIVYILYVLFENSKIQKLFIYDYHCFLLLIIFFHAILKYLYRKGKYRSNG